MINITALVMWISKHSQSSHTANNYFSVLIGLMVNILKIFKMI